MSPRKVTVNYVVIDDARFVEACRLYFLWKDLNNAIKTQTSRGINIPDVITEQMVCWALDLRWNRGSVGGDATDNAGSLIEIKATSNYNRDLSSFSPNTHFDRLIFFRLNQSANTADIYDLGLNGNSFQALRVNNTQTVAAQQRLGRRPRLSLIDYINAQQIAPICQIDIVARTKR